MWTATNLIHRVGKFLLGTALFTWNTFLHFTFLFRDTKQFYFIFK